MCNINVYVRAVSVCENNKDVASFMQNVTAHSYASNSHGDGVAFNGHVIKGLEKVNYFDALELCDARFIMAHQRLSTSGKTAEYTQPFNHNGFIFFHNGIMAQYELKNNTASDSYNAFMALNKVFNRLKENKPASSRKSLITESIKIIFGGAGGWFSIGLFDIEEQTLYYFKNEIPQIHLYTNKQQDSIFLTTNSENGLFYYGAFQIDIKPYCIYEIKSLKNRVSIQTIGKLKKEEIEIIPTSARTIKDEGVIESITGGYFNVGLCSECGAQDYCTYVKDEKRLICTGCLDFLISRMYGYGGRYYE